MEDCGPVPPDPVKPKDKHPACDLPFTVRRASQITVCALRSFTSGQGNGHQNGGYVRGLVLPVITGCDAVSRRGQRRRPIGLSGRAFASYRDVSSTRLLKTGVRTGAGPGSVQVPGEMLAFRSCPPLSWVWLSSGLRSRWAPCEERLKRGLPCSK